MKYLAALAAIVWASGVFAAEPLRSPLDDRFRLTTGVFSAATDTLLRSDANDGSPGTLITAEDDFGMRDRSTMADVEAELRLRPRHKLRFNYFQLDRNASTVLNRQIEFGEQTYLINDVTETQLDISNFSTTYSYLFVRNEKVELGASFGLQLYQFQGAVRVPARLIDEEESEAGPIPVLGLEMAVRISPRFHGEARVEYLSVKIDDVSALFRNFRAAVFYRFTNNISLGGGYAIFTSDATSEDPGNGARWRFDNRGGELLFRVGF